ncbi:MAG TPA: sugar phosphate isomerase/epimerase family protein [Terriglobia bacterium]|nr:sugar phosphate isomerase/epimerase family protein [Terriglobia bacterium]
MTNPITRRRLLQMAGTGAFLGAGLGLPRQADAAAGSKTLESEPRLLPGVCAYSYRKYLKNGQMTMQDFIRKAVELGSTGADMTVYWFKSTDPAYLAGLRNWAFKNGVPFSGAACHASLVQADRAKRAEVLEEIKKWVDVTDRLGASHLRIFAGELPPGATLQQGVQWTVDGLKEACDYSGKKGIALGIEDHGGITQQASVCLEIMQRVDSPYAGINLDITHFIPTPTKDRYAQIASCIPYATNTHIRDRFDGGKPIDMDRVWRLFAEGGYKGFMSVEYQGKEDPMTGVPKLMNKVKALCRKYSTTA